MTTGDVTVIRDAAAPAVPAGRAGSPAWAVARKEWTELARDARWKALIGVTLLLRRASLALGLLRLQRFERAHHAAAGDRRVWTAQGAKNPHSAAHFGQYAFKPVGPLAVAECGVDEFAGNAVWLEAHKQNGAQFRTVRDGTLTARMGRLTLAFVLQAVLPLMAILLGFAAFSGEREAGTLPQLLSLGVRPRDLLLGKGLAGGMVLLGLLALAVA
ncbi:MAG: ABC transporter permease subunit [Isosphaeraceae bacterium]|nr:ABC transporter permease subunit [Isosphaeraceae bacterium]